MPTKPVNPRCEQHRVERSAGFVRFRPASSCNTQAGRFDGTWKELLAKDGLDAIVSAIPCDLHGRCYLDMIAAGKDLYGEKPMCLNRADLDTVVKAARASKQIVQVGHQRRADPHFVEPIRAVRGGEIGNLVEGRILWSNCGVRCSGGSVSSVARAIGSSIRPCTTGMC
jgi:predicted dehydrogenase